MVYLRVIFFIVCCFFLSHNTLAESIEAKDTMEVTKLIMAANKLLMKHPDSSYQMLHNAILQSKKLNWPRGEVEALRRLNSYYSLRNQFNKCHETLHAALTISRESKLKKLEALVYASLANHFQVINAFDSAVHYLTIGEQVSKSLNDTFLIASNYINWFVQHQETKDTASAEAPLLAAIDIVGQSSKKKNYKYLLYLASDFYANTREYAKRAVMLERYLEESFADPKMRSSYDLYHQNILRVGYKNEPPELIQKIEKDLKLHLENENDYGAFYSRIYLGDLYAETGNQPMAEKSFLDAINMEFAKERPHSLALSNKKIAEYYKTINQPAKALEYYLVFSHVRDSMQGVEIIAKTKELETKYQTAEKEAQIAQQNMLIAEQAEAKSKLTYALIGIGLLALMSIGFLIYRTRNIRLLKSKNEIIQKSLDDKEILLKEIHHRVKNNLQVISGLLKWQSSFIEDSQALHAFNEGQNRVQSMAIIHQKLYQSENLTGIEMQDYISRLSQSLFHSYNIHPDKIKLTTDVKPINLDIDTVIPLGLILNELISNALKHAFPGDENGELTVRLSENASSGELMLSVQDNGVGMNEEKTRAQRASFGWELVETLSKKLKAQLDVEQQEGTRINLRIKNYKVA